MNPSTRISIALMAGVVARNILSLTESEDPFILDLLMVRAQDSWKALINMIQSAKNEEKARHGA